jgi:hypothetical protein
MLGHGPSKDLDGTTATRGERNPTATLGFDPLPSDDIQLEALRDALGALTERARSELYVLMRIGQGHLGAEPRSGIAALRRRDCLATLRPPEL